jgi:hypothetical protein
VGFFKDVHKLQKMGEEMRANSPSPAEQMAGAQAQMAQATAMMTQQAQAAQAVAADGVPGVASVVSAVQSGPIVNFDPTIQLELLVTAGSFPAYPTVVQAVVPQLHLARAQPGAVVPVMVARSDPAQVVVDWNRPV